MQKDVIKDLQMNNRDDVVSFLKSLWQEKPQCCPKCGGELDYLHKKAKKNNSDWKCKSCGEIYKAISILKQLPDK